MVALDLTTGRVALIVVDIQAGATNGESALDHVGQHEAVPKAVDVLRAVRALGLPVIHFKEVQLDYHAYVVEDAVYGSDWDAHHAALRAMAYLQGDARVTAAEFVAAAAVRAG